LTKRNLQAGARQSAGLRLSVFSETDIEDIHLATLEVLERTGVFVEDPAALDVFADGGCRVDRERRVVRIPGHVVEDALRAAPAKVVLCGRDSAKDIVLEGGRVGFSNFGEGTSVVDLQTGALRDSVKRDVCDAARLVDCLPEIDCFEIAVGANDMPPETASIHNHEAALLNTTKPVSGGPLDGYAVQSSLAMLAAIAGSEDAARERPQMVFGTCPVSPLQLGRELCEIVLATARAGFPSCVLSMAMAGGSSPVTLAGTLVTHNAEVIAGLTLAQLAGRGVPVLYGSSTTAMDLRLATASVGSPELALISAGAAQLARHYRLPSYIAGA
jgi:trimethylamine--corrinoid protein Co-methyltransferase